MSATLLDNHVIADKQTVSHSCILLVVCEKPASKPRQKQEEDNDRYGRWQQQAVVVVHHV